MNSAFCLWSFLFALTAFPAVGWADDIIDTTAPESATCAQLGQTAVDKNSGHKIVCLRARSDFQKDCNDNGCIWKKLSEINSGFCTKEITKSTVLKIPMVYTGVINYTIIGGGGGSGLSSTSATDNSSGISSNILHAPLESPALVTGSFFAKAKDTITVYVADASCGGYCGGGGGDGESDIAGRSLGGDGGGSSAIVHNGNVVGISNGTPGGASGNGKPGHGGGLKGGDGYRIGSCSSADGVNGKRGEGRGDFLSHTNCCSVCAPGKVIITYSAPTCSM